MTRANTGHGEVESNPHRRAANAFARRVASELSDAAPTIRLSGSGSRGEATSDSDVDLFIALRVSSAEARLREIAYEVELDHAVPVSIAVETESALAARRDHPFVRAVDDDGEVLYG